MLQAGDKIKLTDAQAANLANRICDPKEVVVKGKGDAKQTARIQELEGQVAELTTQLEAERAKSAGLTTRLEAANKK